jgi:hypothetical protein
VKPTCRLIGEDGNVFNLIGLTSRTLKEAGQRAEAKEFTERAFACHSYDAVLTLIGEYVEITGDDELKFEDCDHCGTVGCDGSCEDEEERGA